MNTNAMNKSGSILRSRRHTLVELMVSVLVLAIFVSLAVPSFSNLFDRRRLEAASEHLYGQLRLARTEAIKRSVEVDVSINADNSETWALGISDAGICDPTAALGEANDCTLDIDGVAVLEVSQSADFPDVSMSVSANSTRFDPVRGTADALAVTMRTGNYQSRVIVSLLGAVRLCSPDDSFPGMPSC